MGNRGIESLREYLMLASDRVHAELYTLSARGKWELTEASSPEATIEIVSCGCSLMLAGIYRKVLSTDAK